MKPLALTLAGLLLVAPIAGCSAPAANLKTSCDSLAAVAHEFGEVMPSKERYAEFLPRFQAVLDAGDAESKAVLGPLVAAVSAGAQGDSSAVFTMAGASIGLLTKCAAAGSTAYASASPSSSASAEARNVYVDVRVELDQDAMLAVEDLSEGDDCIPAAEFGDLAGDVSVSVRDAAGEVVGVEDLPQLRLAVTEGGDSLEEAYCAAKVGVVGVPTGRSFYSVKVGQHEVDMSESDLFASDAVVALGSIPE